MRPDQLQRLRELSEKLADVVLVEADPDEWPGAGRGPAEMDQQTRGDRYWCKKNAAATFALLVRAQEIVDKSGGDQPPPDADVERDISRYEREAAKALERIRDAGAKATFDKRTHGR